ncbi:sigma-70 family RNA polymerase sigma factor [Candidatus Latescibacterota bacterium]
MTEYVDLVAQARGGDLHAYGALVERFRRMAVGYAEARLGDYHLAEDVAQEAFVHAYLAMGQLRDAAAFPGWLRQIVWTYCNRLQRRPTHRVSPPDGEIAVPADQEADLDRRELREQLRLAVAGLPDAERTVTHLFYFEDLSQKEIASFLELPLTTVKYRLYASRQRLKPKLEGEFADMVKQTAREDRSDLAARVQELLKVMETLHEELSARYQAALSASLGREVQVRVGAVEQTTRAAFVELLPDPCFTYQFHMEPLRSVAIMDLRLELARAIAGRDELGPMTEADYGHVAPTLATMLHDLESAWGLLPVAVHDIELETHPDVFLAELEERGTAEESVIHVDLEVTAGDLHSGIRMSYGVDDLESLLPYLPDRAQAAPGAADLSIVDVTPETRYLVANMLPLHCHDQGAFGHFGNNANIHAVPGSSPTARTLQELSDSRMRGWWEQPEVFHPLLVMMGDKPVGYALVETLTGAPEGVQYRLSMPFLHHRFREQVIEDHVLRLIVDRYRGEWEISVHPQDQQRQDTVRRVLSDNVPGGFRSGRDVSTVGGRSAMAYRFSNKEQAAAPE